MNMFIRPLLITGVFLGLFSWPVANLWGQSCNAGFSWTVSGCNTVVFTPDSVSSSLVYQWNFGDGAVSSSQAPTHTYLVENSGNYSYNVRLIVTGTSCIDTVVRSVQISVDALPDASITSDGLDPAFVKCGSTSQNPDYELTVINQSSTQSTNTNYSINWGDNSPPYQSSSFSTPVTHLYQAVGLFDIIVTVRGSNQCIRQDTFKFFNGSNPGGNLANISNTTDCITTTKTWPIENVAGNPPGTTYKIWVNDGGDTSYFNHPPPLEFSYTFTRSSCDPDMGDDGLFKINFESSNPCRTTLTTSEVTMYRPPEAEFSIQPSENQCKGSEFVFENMSLPALYVSGNMCRDSMKTRWTISPNTN